jgi:hypothetical protein
MGNKPLPPSFWARLGKTEVGPCRTCKSFMWWNTFQGGAIISARCERHGICHDPRVGCEDWQREPGSDDEEGTWPPVGRYVFTAPPAVDPRQRAIEEMIARQRAAGW